MDFSRADTKMIKGVAIILMLLDHLLINFQWQPISYPLVSQISINGLNAYTVLGRYGGICVSLFMFLGGYGLFLVLNNNRVNISDGGVFFNKVKSLYGSYWKVFLVFVPIGFLFFSNQDIYCSYEGVCTVFKDFNRIEFISNFLAISCTYNYEWWFFRPFICAVFLGILFNHLLKKTDSAIVASFWVLLLYILIYDVFPEICYRLSNVLLDNVVYVNFFMINPHVLPFFAGMVFAKFDGLSKCIGYFECYKLGVRVTIGILVIVISILFREFITEELDILLAPIQVIAYMLIFKDFHYIRKFLLFIGNHSTNIWLCHSFFCYYFGCFAKMVFYTQTVLGSLITLLAMSLIASFLIDSIWNAIGKVFRKYAICSTELPQ